MASVLQKAVTDIRLGDYVTLVILTTVGYDYILTFSDELEYIWNKPWTRISTLFILVRYPGLCYNIISSLRVLDLIFSMNLINMMTVGRSFIPGPEKLYVFVLCRPPTVTQANTLQIKQVVLGIIAEWALLIFVFAADLSMILRVWALHNRARITLYILLTLLAIEVIPFLIYCIRLGTSNGFTAITIRILNYSLCETQPNISAVWIDVTNFAAMALGILMCLFIVVRFATQTFQIYRATGDFQLNQYIGLLVREGMVYLLVVLVFAIFNALSDIGHLSNVGWKAALKGIGQGIPPFTLVPRFILNLRKLNAHDTYSKYRNDGNKIDTAFGFNSSRSSNDIAAPVKILSDPTHNEGRIHGEEMQLEEMTGRGDVRSTA